MRELGAVSKTTQSKETVGQEQQKSVKARIQLLFPDPSYSNIRKIIIPITYHKQDKK